MNLTALTSRDAVLAAMAEYDALGREAFLQAYGFGAAKQHFVVHDGKNYDSKAIAGVAVGKQFPDRGPMRNDEFSGGEKTVKAKLQALGFSFVDETTITSDDVALLRQSKSKSKYGELSDDERGAYIRVTGALKELGTTVVRMLGDEEYELRLTSGFHLGSGVRGSIPKDLWFGIYAKENAGEFAGTPQLFMIVSERGVEFGYAPSTHPSGFSNSEIKAAVRAAAPKIFDLLPRPGSVGEEDLRRALELSGEWYFRRRTRLTPNQTDFPDLASWLAFLHSSQGKADAGGSISKYVLEPDVDNISFAAEVIEMAEIYRSIMESVRAQSKPPQPSQPTPLVRDANQEASFADLTTSLLDEFGVARERPFGVVEPLWKSASRLRQWLQTCAPIAQRPHLNVSWSPGKGVWAKVPWIAVLNKNVTTTTQEGLYCVFLIAEDLSTIYLTLAQGVTQLIDELGSSEGARVLEERAGAYRANAQHLQRNGFTLGNDIDLKCDGSLAKNYQRSVIAYMKLDAADLPANEIVRSHLEALMAVYDELSATNAVAEVFEIADEPATIAQLPIYTVDDAIDGLFMAKSEFERILSIWHRKKNLILQGAPGVGKSFVAKRLAYALIGAKDPARVQTVQFHQSYGYEDFVQGYRPDDQGGFSLKDGVFYEFCKQALSFPEQNYVFIIDEINRGNLSKIFGELMLLIEGDKRSFEWAARLAYSKPDDASFYVPPNVHIIGMMNTADRSLSLVDYALRRRFGFVTLPPQFDSPAFASTLIAQGVQANVAQHVANRMGELNAAIGDDKMNLGLGFRIGHSFFVPAQEVQNSSDWFELVVETEIRPLLEEYWLDDLDKVDTCCAQLMSGLA